MKFQPYILFNDNWCEISLQNIRVGNIIKYKDLETNEFLLNADGTEVSIAICDAYKNEDDSWSIQTIPYIIKNENSNLESSEDKL